MLATRYAPLMLTREQLLASPLSALTRYWLDVRCTGCTKVTQVAVSLLASRARRAKTLADILPRLKCRYCGGAPKRVVALDRAPGGDPLAVRPGEVELWP